MRLEKRHLGRSAGIWRFDEDERFRQRLDAGSVMRVRAARRDHFIRQIQVIVVFVCISIANSDVSFDQTIVNRVLEIDGVRHKAAPVGGPIQRNGCTALSHDGLE